MPRRTDDLNGPFEQGADARLEGLKLDDNPYGPGSAERAEWSAGFSAACDLDEEDDPASNRLKPAFD